ncbi:hypothetical protein [Jannaschia helgolandensis]|nr:hypothetical protein [Jannaschia helgolandensis]
MRNLVIAAICSSVLIAAASASFADDSSRGEAMVSICKNLNGDDFLSVSRSEDLEWILQKALSAEAGISELQCLMSHFNGSGDGFRATYHPGGGVGGSDVFRFSIDRIGFFNRLFRPPGGEGGRYLAIFRVTDDAIAIIKTGGVAQWLK